MLEIELEVDEGRLDQVATIEEQHGERKQRPLSPSNQRKHQEPGMQRDRQQRRDRGQKARGLDEVILEDTCRVKLRYEPVIEVVGENSRLRQDALIQAEVPRWSNGEKIVTDGFIADLQADERCRQHDERAQPQPVHRSPVARAGCKYRDLEYARQQRQQRAVFLAENGQSTEKQ